MGGNRRSGRKWCAALAALLVVLAGVCVVAGVITRYVRDNLLDTDGYVAIVGPLPKEPTVAAALGTYTTERLFDATNAQANIKEFLPPKLAPLAAPLSDSLQKKVTEVTTQFVGSDKFSAVWIAANQTAHKAVLRVAESETQPPRQPAVGSVDLSGLLGAVRQRVDGDRAVFTQKQKDRAAEIRVNLHQSVEQLRFWVRAIRNGAAVLPYVSVALLLLAMAVAYSRRRAVMGIGIALVLFGISMTLVFKGFSGAWLGDISNPTYRAAADTIYQAFYDDLQRRIGMVMATGGLLFVLAILASQYTWTQKLRAWLRVSALKRTAPYSWARQTRRFTAKYELWFYVMGAGFSLLALLLAAELSLSTVVMNLSLLAGYMAVVHLVAHPAPIRKRFKKVNS